MKRREVWIETQSQKQFSEMWGSYPACHRLERFLGTNAGRSKILVCVKARVGLSGDPKNPSVRGIEECHVVVEELRRMQNEKLHASTEDQTTTTPPSAGGSVPDTGAAGGSVPAAGGGYDESDGLAFFEKEATDPVEQKALELSLKEMLHINSFADVDTLLKEIEETVSKEPV